MQTHSISVTKTARYYTLGNFSENTTEVLFLVHGFSQLASTFLKDFEVLQKSNRVLIAPEALNKFYIKGGSEVAATWMTKEDRLAEIVDYVNYLNQLYDFIMAKNSTVKISVLGFSQGVATVSRWVHSNTRVFENLIFYAGELGNELQNVEKATFFRATNKYYVYGKKDPYITPEDLHELKLILPDFSFLELEGAHEIKAEQLIPLIK